MGIRTDRRDRNEINTKDGYSMDIMANAYISSGSAYHETLWRIGNENCYI